MTTKEEIMQLIIDHSEIWEDLKAKMLSLLQEQEGGNHN